MNISERSFRNKLSIYDLILAKTKRSEKLDRDTLKKKLFINLSDIDTGSNYNAEKQNINGETKNVYQVFSHKNQESNITGKINVLMEGKAVKDAHHIEINSDTKKNDFILERFQKNILEEDQVLSFSPIKSLAVVSDLGTIHKHAFSRRPGRLVPISTLKSRQVQIFTSHNFSISKEQSDFIDTANETEDQDQEINNFQTNPIKSIENETSESIDEHKQRKRSKIRSVEEILSSLKSDDYIHNQMESDNRIDQLIKKVLERTDDEDDTYTDEEVGVVETVTEEFVTKEVDGKGDFEREAERVLEELEKEQSLRSLDTNLVNEASIRDSLSHVETERAISEMEERSECIDNKDMEMLLDLELDENVTNEDLVAVYGDRVDLKERRRKAKESDGKGMSVKVDIEGKHGHKSIHHICSMHDTGDPRIAPIRKQWVAQYIPDKYPNHNLKADSDVALTDLERIEQASLNIMAEKEKIEQWEMIAQELLKENGKMEIIGTFIAATAPRINDVWPSIAPKLYLQPHKAREVVCPLYNIGNKECLVEEVTRENTFERASTADLAQSTENSVCDDIDLEAMETKEKLMSRRNGSMVNIASAVNGILSQNVTVPDHMTRSSSVPNRHWLEEDSLIIHLEYHQIMEEINIQKQHIQKLNVASQQINDQIESPQKNNTEVVIVAESDKENHPTETGLIESNKENSDAAQATLKDVMTPAQKAFIAGQNYVYYPPRRSRKVKRKQSQNIARISDIEEFINREPNKLQKTESFSNLSKMLSYSKKKPKKDKPRIHITKHRSNSLSKLQSFADWSSTYGYINEDSAREWITVVWDKWFDEVYPPLPDNNGMISPSKAVNPNSRDITSNIKESSMETSSLTTTNEILDLPEKIDVVLEEVDEEFRDSVIETLHEEVSNLTKEMTLSKKPNAFLLSRRGSIYRKLGFLRGALRDLDQAISLEPELLTAYWERHLLHLTCNKLQTAIEDLNYILKRDKNNVPAYKSRASIYASLGDNALALSNLSQAIRLAPDDTDAYLKRADLYDKNGDHRMALEDYNQLIQLQPNNSLAMMKHGLYYINIEQWQLAIKDFTDILRHDPLNAEARLYRGLALSKLHQWQEALLDYSAVIHLDPNNSKAYFRRGCLLQTSDPSMSIRDFSISLLLDSSDDNILSYLHRAVLYAQTKQYSEAIVDFEMVIYFSKDMCCAHVDLGLIYFENEDFEKAIKYFTTALAADPTYLRAYVCRAEAHFKINMYDEAIKDINRAIHIYPDRSNYYMLRGDFYLAKGKMKLAEMCVRQAAAISHSLGQSLVQQALVHSFLHNYDQAIDALYQSTRSKPTLALLNLLGMTQMKAKRWKDAITSFSICLEQMKPKSQFKPWPPAAANLYFMVAQCYLELNDYKQSQQAFKATVKINSKHAEAFYQQGWCRLRLGQLKKGILDLNQALAINPKLYQAYLARATLFGYKEQYTKAILNCNEVLNIEPKCLRAFLYRGVLKYQIKAYSLAVKDLTEAINLDPSCILAYFNRALCYNAEKRYFRTAIQDYSIVLLLTDELELHQKSYLNRGIVYLELGDVKNALFDFKKAHSMQPNNINVLMAVGICHHRLKNLNDAVLTFSRCLDSNPKFYLARICRGNAYMDFNTLQSQEMAVKDFESVLNSDRNNLEAHINLGFCMQAQGKFKKAWEIFTKAIDNHPYSIKPLDGRAIVCLQMRDLQGALKDLNSAIAVNPQSPMLYTNRAVVHQLLGDGIRSMKDYNKAILIDEEKSSIAYYNIGCIYLHNFQIQQAFDSFTSSINIDPSDEATWMNLALVHVFNNKLEDSLICIDKAISINPYVAFFYYNRANLLCQMNEYLEAEKDFTKCLKISPDDAQVHKARADCRGKLGDTAGAIHDYKISVYISSCQRKRAY